MKITEDMMVCEILDMDGSLEDLLAKHGLPCSGCPGAAQETLLDAAEAHGLDIEELLCALNKNR